MTVPDNEVYFVFEMTNCDLSSGLRLQKKVHCVSHTASSLSESLVNLGLSRHSVQRNSRQVKK